MSWSLRIITMPIQSQGIGQIAQTTLRASPWPLPRWVTHPTS